MTTTVVPPRAHPRRGRAALLAGAAAATLLATLLVPATAAHASVTSMYASPRAFSPNGDGIRDTSVVRWSSTTGGRTVLRVIDAAGTTVRGPIGLGTLAAGPRALRWDGRDNAGRLVSSRDYRFTVLIGSGTSAGRGTANVTVDRIRPGVTAPAAATVYPVADGYRDSTTISWRVSEATSGSVLQLRNSAGAIARSFTLGPRAAGTVSVTWNGKTSGGRIVPAGAYTLRLAATDNAGNTTVTQGRVSVSTASLRTVSGSTLITPRWTVSTAAVGSCSFLARDADVRTGWAGSIGLYSDYQQCGRTGGPDLVTTTHAITPPRPQGFVRWQTLGVGGYGDQALWQSGQDAKATLLKRDLTTASARTLASPFGAWATSSVPAAQVLDASGRMRWRLSVDTGSWYEVKYFTLRWTATVLR